MKMETWFQIILLWSILFSENKLYILYNYFSLHLLPDMEYLIGFLVIQEFIFEFSSLLISVKEKVWRSDNFTSDSKGPYLF